MLNFVVRRLLYMIPTLIVISMVAFLIIELPPGDYLTTMVSRMSQGGEIDQSMIAALRERYGLGEPIYVQYFKWITGILFRLDFGMSFEWNQPVSQLLARTVPPTIVISALTIIFTWTLAIPIAIYSAVRQYSVGDYIVTGLGFLGLAVPSFMIALALGFVSVRYFNQSVGGLFSPAYVDAPWSVDKAIDFLKHLWVPIVVLGLAGTAGLIRILRANLLDELRKPYVVAARARGVPERTLLFKYPLRVAMNPFFSTIGWLLPHLISNDIVVSSVLGLPTTGPLLLRALTSQDMYLAGSAILIISALTVVGTLISDIALAWLDPRVRLSVGGQR
jgi:peptide/nickel transport system permease protein